MKLVALTGTADAFARLVQATQAYAAAHPQAEVWIQYGKYAGPRTLPGEAYAPHASIVERIAAADVVVCHAGSGTLRDAIEAGHVPVVMPRLAKLGEHVNDHQLDVAGALGAAGRALVVPEGAPIDPFVEQAAARRGPPPPSPAHAFSAAVANDIEHTRARARTTRAWLGSLIGRVTRAVRLTRMDT